MGAMHATAELPREIPVVVPIERIDRASLAAIAYARSISRDVTTLWAADADLATYLQRRGGRGVVVVQTVIVPRPRWLYPLVNLSAFLRARRARRNGAAVVTVPVRL